MKQVRTARLRDEALASAAAEENVKSVRTARLLDEALASAAAEEDGGDGDDQQPQIVGQRAAAHVGDVHANPFVESDARAALHLPDAREPWRDVQSPPVPGATSLGLVARP